MKISKKDKKGFTLIELLVVVAIIGLLSSVVMTALGSAKSRGRDTKRIADIKEVLKALELYYSDNGRYPLDAGTLSSFSSGGVFAPIISNYLDPLPVDPLGESWVTGGYQYIRGNGSSSYGIRVRFETMNQDGIIFDSAGNGYGWCLTGSNVWYGWFSGGSVPLPQCTAIPSI